MVFMDLLFKEYASPFFLLDQVIANGQLVRFLETFEEQRSERSMWEYYIHKLGPWDDRSYEQFRHDILYGTNEEVERPSNEQLETTVHESYEMMKNFVLEERGDVDGSV